VNSLVRTHHARLHLASLVVLIAAAAGRPGWAAQTPTDAVVAGSPTEAAVAPATEYLLGPGYSLRITNPGSAEYNGVFRVGADGRIRLRDQMGVEVQVAGLTLEQAQSLIVKSVARYVRQPVLVVELAQFPVLVTGAVKTPGMYEVDAGELLMQAITMAGGANTPEDLGAVYLRRLNGAMQSLDLRGLLERGDPASNLALLPGDSVAVGYLTAPPEQQYRVSGAVQTPGLYKAPRGEGVPLPDAVQAAGGLSPDSDGAHCTLIRSGGQRQLVDLAQVMNTPTASGPELRPGDEFFVPRLPVAVMVVGAVARPGRYQLAEGTTCLDAVSQAGGFTTDAILQQISLVRGQPPTRTVANLQQALQKGDMTQNLTLQDGDVLYVPRREPKQPNTTWLDVTRVLQPLLWILR
jgi:protein involved in polysaccharide export with SLBB domain